MEKACHPQPIKEIHREDPIEASSVWGKSFTIVFTIVITIVLIQAKKTHTCGVDRDATEMAREAAADNMV